ncbi:galactose-binding lectin l-1-like [Gadus morhua]|uniref:galactose-binding lectin l-1-like n=1 Tax=Gadus morhua TaxID=8049 RepID=UPI0011B4E4B4|nr:galactose-binding lectin l-1-like [Gadus morhua]
MRVGAGFRGQLFALDIYSGANITLHMDVRFNLNSHERVMLCNSLLEEVWGEEVIHRTFPFNYDEFFKFTVTLTREEFLVVLSDSSEIHFPNRLGASEYKTFSFNGGVLIRSFEIN